jgi:hypothetical protein
LPSRAAAGNAADQACSCLKIRTIWKQNERMYAQTVRLNYT